MAFTFVKYHLSLWSPEDKNETIIIQYFTSNQLLFLPHTWSSNEVKEISSM